MKVKLSNVRIAFCNTLFKAERVGADASSEPRFGAVFVIEPGSANAKALTDAVKATAVEKWKDKGAAVLKDLQSKGRVAYSEGPKTNSSGEVYDGFEGMHHLNSGRRESEGRPLVIDANTSPLTQADGKPYGGCYVNATVDIWPQDNNWGRRINATLLAVQFLRDGDAFSGGAKPSADDFEDVSAGSDAEALA